MKPWEDWRTHENLVKNWLANHFIAKASLGGFYYFFAKNGRGKQRKYLLSGIARLAKEYPNVSPRVYLLEYLAEEIYKYEQYLKKTVSEGVEPTEELWSKEISTEE